MTNDGFRPYMDLTTNAKAAGGPEQYLAGIRAASVAVGLLTGAAGVVGTQWLTNPDGPAAKAWRCRVRRTHRPVRVIKGVQWDGDSALVISVNPDVGGLRGTITDSERKCRDCGAPCPA